MATNTITSPGSSGRQSHGINTAIQGSVDTYIITWIEDDGTAFDLTSATLAAYFQDANGDQYVSTGTLSLSDAANGIFTWQVSADDTGANGNFKLQFKAVISGTTHYSRPVYWRIESNLSAGSVPSTGVLVGVSTTEAAWLTAALATVPDASDLPDPTSATDGYVWTADGANGADWEAVGLHDPVTLVGSYDYLTLAGQAITRNQIDLASDVTGILPGGNYTNYTDDIELNAIAGLTSAANKLPYFTGSGTAALADLTVFGRSIIDDANEAAFKATVNLEIGTDVQAWDAQLDDIAALVPGTEDTLITSDGLGGWTKKTAASFITDNNILDTADIGTSIQGWDANLDQVAALAVTDGNFMVGNGSAWIAESGATARASLGLGTMATETEANYLLVDGSRQLSADWDIGDGLRIETDEIRARDAAGLGLYDDSGNGIFIEDGGEVGIGVAAPTSRLHVYQNIAADLSGVFEQVNASYASYVVNKTASTYAANRFITSTSTWSFGLLGSTSFRILDEDNTKYPVTIQAGAEDNTLYIRSNSRVGIGTYLAAAKLHVDQSSLSAGIPALTLAQADLSEEFINFVSTVGAGYPIDATTAAGTYYGRARVAVNGTFKYIHLYNA